MMTHKIDVTNIVLSRSLRSYNAPQPFGSLVVEDATSEVRSKTNIYYPTMIQVFNNMPSWSGLSDITQVEVLIEKITEDDTSVVNLYNFDEWEILDLKEQRNLASWLDTSRVYALLIPKNEENDAFFVGSSDSSFDNLYDFICYDYSSTEKITFKQHIKDNTRVSMTPPSSSDYLLLFWSDTTDNTTVYVPWQLDSWSDIDFTSFVYDNTTSFYTQHPQFKLSDVKSYNLDYSFTESERPSGSTIVNYKVNSNEPQLFMNKFLSYSISTNQPVTVSLCDSDNTTYFSNSYDTSGQFEYNLSLKRGVDYHIIVECDDILNGFTGSFTCTFDFTIYDYLPFLYVGSLVELLEIFSTQPQVQEEDEATSQVVIVGFGIPISNMSLYTTNESVIVGIMNGTPLII